MFFLGSLWFNHLGYVAWEWCEFVWSNKWNWYSSRPILEYCYIFIQENPFQNVLWKIAAILSWPQCVNNKWGLVQVMLCNKQVISHLLNQQWSGFVMQYVIIRLKKWRTSKVTTLDNISVIHLKKNIVISKRCAVDSLRLSDVYMGQ